MSSIVPFPPDYLSSGWFFSDPVAQQYIKKNLVYLSRFGDSYALWWEANGGVYIPYGLGEFGATTLDKRDTGLPVQYENLFIPRYPEQQKMVDDSLNLLKAGRNHILNAPTGAGKTYMGCAIAAKMNTRTVVVTTKEDIVYQWVQAAKDVLGLSDDEIGIWQGDRVPLPQHKFVVGLVQSLSKGEDRYPDAYKGFGLFISDEVHRMSADQFSQTMQHFSCKYKLGLSATPYRKDGKDNVFLEHIGSVSVTGKQETLIPKILVKQSTWKVPVVKVGNKYKQLPHTAGKTIHLNKFMAKDKGRLNLIASFLYQAVSKKRTTLMFCDTLKELEAIEKTLIDMGVTSGNIGWYIGLTSKRYKGTKAQKQDAREAATVKPIILTTYKMCSEGTNLPWVDTCVLGSPKSDVIQIVGRIRRVYEDKKLPVVLDIIDKDSHIFHQYAKKRLKWYRSLGSEIVYM